MGFSWTRNYLLSGSVFILLILLWLTFSAKGTMKCPECCWHYKHNQSGRHASLVLHWNYEPKVKSAEKSWKFIDNSLAWFVLCVTQLSVCLWHFLELWSYSVSQTGLLVCCCCCSVWHTDIYNIYNHEQNDKVKKRKPFTANLTLTPWQKLQWSQWADKF